MRQNFQQFEKRRDFFKWMSQIVAGASLASIGFDLTTSPNALAASKPNTPPPCYACPPYGQRRQVCLCPAPNCSSDRTASIVTYYGGCAPQNNICYCQQTFSDAGYCCSAGATCYCS